MFRFLLCLALVGTCVFAGQPVSFDEVAPILEKHCQSCHRAGEMAPMSLESYEQARPWAQAIASVAQTRTMPPWFADPHYGRFANDPSLSGAEIQTLVAWAAAHAPKGSATHTEERPHWTYGWQIQKPDAVFTMPKPMQLPASGDVPYQYIVLPQTFTRDTWVQLSEIRPSNRMVVHHAVAYIRPPGSQWLKGAPIGTPFSADDLPTPEQRRDAMWTTSDILLVYAPGSSPDQWPAGYAKLIPAGSQIILQMHYTAHGAPMQDQTSVALSFAKQPPTKRVLTLQLTNDRFLIPPGDPDHRVEVHGTIPNDAELLSFFPHMHLRGKTFEYNLIEHGQAPKTLLRIPNYSFFWQLSYRLQTPIQLKAGCTLQAVATFDNSKANKHNPDPDSAVTWGEQTWAEMMVGFFDVAVDPSLDKDRFFIRTGHPPTRHG